MCLFHDMDISYLGLIGLPSASVTISWTWENMHRKMLNPYLKLREIYLRDFILRCLTLERVACLRSSRFISAAAIMSKASAKFSPNFSTPKLCHVTAHNFCCKITFLKRDWESYHYIAIHIIPTSTLHLTNILCIVLNFSFSLTIVNVIFQLHWWGYKISFHCPQNAIHQRFVHNGQQTKMCARPSIKRNRPYW